MHSLSITILAGTMVLQARLKKLVIHPSTGFNRMMKIVYNDDIYLFITRVKYN